ncbi:glutathione S-transferase U17-like [Coffea eugenioides]|uniref:glutathione S-transferase U17-like n=1 Tax=Coffea eugenioides TaxID=49369 RepID=UPI000F614F1A|nr:glutathione S-transferase U17-like [Coffea eugenioides]
MAASDVKLLGARPSPFVNRVQVALNLKSIDYEFIPQNLAEKSELLLKSNPVHKKVPVLIHGDQPISESLVIVQYVDEVWSGPPSLLPADPYDRATARFWAAYIDEKWSPLVRNLINATDEQSKAAAAEKVFEGLKLLEDAFVNSSKGKGFFGGEKLGFLDVVLGCYLGWVRAGEIITGLKILDETKTAALVGWAERFTSNKAVDGVIPEPEELVNFMKMQARAAAAADASSK